MKRLASSFFLCVLLSFSVFLLSCEKDSYEKGEGRYSLLQADFTYLTINSEKQAVSFLTDEGESFLLTNPQKASWIETADTIYRAILYYNKVESNKAHVTSMASLPTLKPRQAKEYKRLPKDPVGLESSWLTRDGKYINLGLLLKNGRDASGKEGTHSLAVALDESNCSSYSSGEKSSLPTPQIGHTQSSGMSSNAVPGAIPLSGSPTSGSYT